MTESCKYENLLGQMASDISHIKDDQTAMKDTTSKIFDALDGIAPKVAVLESQQKDAPTLRKMMSIGAMWGGVSAAFIVIGFFAIKAMNGG